MSFKLFYLLIALNISCINTKDPINDNLGSKRSNPENEKGKDTEKSTSEINNSEDEEISKEEVDEDLKKSFMDVKVALNDLEEGLHYLELIMEIRGESEIRGELEIRDELRGVVSQLPPDFTCLEIDEQVEENKKVSNDSSEKDLNLESMLESIKEMADELSKVLSQFSPNLTSSEIDRQVEENKKVSNDSLQEAVKSKKRKLLTTSEIEAKINENKKTVDNTLSISKSSQVESVISKVDESTIDNQKKDLTISEIEREKEWIIGSINSERSPSEGNLYNGENSSYIFKDHQDAEPGSYSDYFKPTTQKPPLNDSDIQEIFKNRKFLSDSKVENDENLSDSENF